jgi:hypothetical protein
MRRKAWLAYTMRYLWKSREIIPTGIFFEKFLEQNGLVMGDYFINLR